MALRKPISPLDLVWLLTDTKESPTHVGVLLLFEKPAGEVSLVADLVAEYRRQAPVPPYNFVPEIGRSTRPVFREAGNYDPTYHVGHVVLPKGASHDDLLRLVADLHEPSIDHARPMFRTWFIDGVPGHRFALYVKVQHAIVDGISGARRIHESLSVDAGRRVRPSFFSGEAPVRKSRPPRAAADTIGVLASRLGSGVQVVKELSADAIGKATLRLLGYKPGGSLPFTAHRAPMNEPLKMSRSFATLKLPLGEMHAVARHFGATLNDLAVTIVDAGIHSYLVQTGREFPQRLVAMCPVSLRSEGDTTAGTQASAMFVHLGNPTAVPKERLAQVKASMAEGKKDLRGMSKDAALIYAVAVLGLAEASKTVGVDRFTPPLANVVISNVPGGKEVRYLRGAKLVGTYPVSAIAASIGLNVTLTSYGDGMDFGFVGNGATMYDLPSLAGCVEAAYGELRAASTRRKSGARGPRRRAARPARRKA